MRPTFLLATLALTTAVAASAVGAPRATLTSDLFIIKNDGQSSYSPGETLFYSIIVGNSGPDEVIGARVTDFFPPEIVATDWTCTGTGGGSCPMAEGTGDIDFLVNLPEGASAVIGVVAEIDVASTADPLINVANVTAPAGTNDPNAGNNSNDDQDALLLNADLSATKTDGSDTYTPGQPITYTIVASNDGPAAVTNATLNDNFPPELENCTWTCSPTAGASCTASGAGSIADSVDLGSGTSLTYTVDCTVAETATEDPMDNAAAISPPSGVSDTNLSNNSGVDSNALALPVDVTLGIGPPAGNVDAGAFAIVTATIGNNGPGIATSVSAVLTPDANTTALLTTGPCTIDSPPGAITCDVGSLASGASMEFDIFFHVAPGAPTAGAGTGNACGVGEDLCWTGSVAANEPDNQPANDSAERAIDVGAATTSAALQVVKDDVETEPLEPGGNVTYRVSIENTGTDAALVPTLYDTFDPTTLGFVSGPAGCSLAAAGIVRCNTIDVTAGASIDVDLVFSIAPTAQFAGTLESPDCDGSEDVCNSVLVGSATPEVDITDNVDTEPTDLHLVIECGNGTLNSGEACDPPASLICNDALDEDADGLIDCAEPDCRTSNAFWCDAECRLAPPCVGLASLKGKLRANDLEPGLAGKKDSLKIKAKFFAQTLTDVDAEGVRIVIANASGPLYSGLLLPGDFDSRVSATKGTFKWKDATAQLSGVQGQRDGIASLTLKHKVTKGFIQHSLKAQILTDFSGATDANMFLQIYVGDDVVFSETPWTGEAGRWAIKF